MKCGVDGCYCKLTRLVSRFASRLELQLFTMVPMLCVDIDRVCAAPNVAAISVWAPD